MSLVGKSIGEIRKLLEDKEASAKEIFEAHYHHIDQHDARIGAFITTTRELALKQANSIDELVRKGEKLPALAGVPVALKDNLCVAGYPTTCASKILASFHAIAESTAVRQLFAAGAVCLGKANMDEFAMGSSTENSSVKVTHNPWNPEYVPGGTSGGSSAAVSAGFSTVALGSDTGGSVRQPASLCGVVGMKPTYGLVSRFGLVAYASSLDQIGPLARSVEDAARTLAVIAGHDPKDSTSLADWKAGGANDFDKLLSELPRCENVKGWRIGIIKELTGEGYEPEVEKAIENAAKAFEQLGATVDKVSIPRAKEALSVYYIICTAEASSNLARYDGVKYGLRDTSQPDVISMNSFTREEGFGPEVKRRIMLGTYVLSSGYYDAYYKKAQQVRRLLCEDFEKIFKDYDFVICPTSPTVAFKIGDKTADPLTMYLQDVASIPVNLAGLPAISIPAGSGRNDLPIGLQMIGPPLGDAKLLRAAYAFEKATPFHTKRPELLSLAQTK
jgi:aspartyl-tRNA(Asn)/glutamyl-tRNA(Gln) amidotransferase subunit A